MSPRTRPERQNGTIYHITPTTMPNYEQGLRLPATTNQQQNNSAVVWAISLPRHKYVIQGLPKQVETS